MSKRRNKPLSVKVTRDGVLTIEIGIDTLSHAFLAAPVAWEMAVPDGEPQTVDPNTKFRISNTRGFAVDVKRELLAEEEDGSSPLTDLLDEACRKAIEEGSAFFVRKDESL